jgi:pimeloyl-ACP methyl ester carboxylesterase
VTIEPIEAETADGVVLRGELRRGRTSMWLVFVHDVGGDIDDWRPAIDAMTGTGWNLLAFDLRGHGGSDGEWNPIKGSLDVEAGVAVARRCGAEHVAILGAGYGAVACLECVSRAVAEPASPLADSLVLLSPGPLENRDAWGLRGEGLAKLIISSSLGAQDADAEVLMRASIGWTVRVTFATGEHGTGLLRGPFAHHVADRVVSFLREQETLVGPGLTRVQSG